MIPVSARNQILSEVRACMIEDGKDPGTCIVETAKRYGLNQSQANELVEELASDED